MLTKQQIQNINKMLQKQIVQKFGVVAVAILVVSSVAFFGMRQNQSSSAAGIGTLSMSPATGNHAIGSTIAVALYENSGTDPVNAVQASLNYDATKLEFISISEATAFPTVAATSTATSGIVRLARGTLADQIVTGNNVIATVNFKVLANSGSTLISYDPAFSYIVRSSDNTNILSSNTGANFSMKMPVPSISIVSPASGPTAGGTQITLSGSNFVSGATVSVGGVAATAVTVAGPTSLTATVPAHVADVYGVVVTNPDGQMAAKAAAFTYLAPAPVMTGVAPAAGLATGGTAITLTGSNFSAPARVLIGGTPAVSVVVVSSTQITAVTPQHAAGAVNIVVTTPNGNNTRLNAFTYNNLAPTLRAVSPPAGTSGGGTLVTITGAGFLSGATVNFGATAAKNVTVVSSTQIRASVPAGTGVVSVAITNPDGQKVTLAAGYAYLALGDANNDGRVNAIDLSVLISRDGQNYSQADFSGDGTVGAADLAILLGRWTW